MTNPARASAPANRGRTSGVDERADAAATEAFALTDLRARVRQVGLHRLLLLLDLIAIGLVAAAYLQLGPPELLFHGVFVILTIDAFLFGRRVCFTRIVASSLALLGYVALPSFEEGIEPLELTEWPLMFTIAILVAWMADREQSAVRRYAALYREARDRLVTAQEEERKRLSRDLHDGIGQTLTALILALDASGPMPADGHLDRARALASSALDEARSVAERVRPPRLESRGLASALNEMELRCGAPVAVQLDPVVAGELAPPHVVEVYRVAQEALGNAVRHAEATAISISIGRARDGLRLEVTDDGIGFDPRSMERAGLGLTGMRERAALMGGRLRIASRPGHGTRVTLVVPLEAIPQTGVVAVDPAPQPDTAGTGA